MKKKPKNSRRKGATAELNAAKFLTKIGFPCRRTAQVRGKTGGCADLEFEDEKLPIHVEVKHQAGLHLNTLALMKACEQAERECRAGFEPVVLWRQSGCWNLSARVDGIGSPWGTMQQRNIEWTLRAIATGLGWSNPRVTVEVKA